jgi:hypothetical protein
MRRSRLLVAGLLTTIVMASGAARADDAAAPVDFKTQIQPILNAQCVFCHVTGAENGGLNLARSVAYQNLVGTPSTESPLVRVAPGKPQDSYLMHKLEGTQVSVGGTGGTMPLIDPPRQLEPSQRALFRAWIEQGAKPAP